MFIRSWLSIILFGFAGLSLQADEPTAVVHRLTDAIRKGDKKAISPFYATLNDKSPDLSVIDRILESDENDFISPTWCFDSKTNGDAAVVLVGSLKGRTLDVDPCYLIRVAGQWRILPEHTQIEVARGAVSESTMQSLQELADWYKPRKKTLYQEIGKELAASWKKETPPTEAEARMHMIEVFSKRDPKGHPTSKGK
jgi:hypothetical protein